MSCVVVFVFFNPIKFGVLLLVTDPTFVFLWDWLRSSLEDDGVVDPVGVLGVPSPFLSGRVFGGVCSTPTRAEVMTSVRVSGSDRVEAESGSKLRLLSMFE